MIDKSIIIEDPNILGGVAVVSGTRVPVSLIFNLLARGYTPDLIVQEYPSVTKKKMVKLFSVLGKSFDDKKETDQAKVTIG